MRAKKENRMRKSTKYVIVLISIVLIIFSLINFVENVSKEDMSKNTIEIYTYNNKFNYDYKVNLIDNRYMTDEDVTDKQLAYVTDLIDNIDLNLNYKYTADKQSNLKYTYSVIGRMNAVYTRDGEEQKIWEKEDVLVEEKDLEEVSDTIDIKEDITLDLKEKNELLKSFEQQLGMSIDAKYIVSVKIKVLTNIAEKDIVVNYTPVLNIDLAAKTTKILGENNTDDTEYISKEYDTDGHLNIFAVLLDIIVAVMAIRILKYAIDAKTTNVIRNEYKYELNRILKLCQDKIVQISTKPNDSDQEVVWVKDFGEIVKISEELFKPILYYDDHENEEAWFSVMSEKTSYRYILRDRIIPH